MNEKTPYIQAVFERAELARARGWLTLFKIPVWATARQLKKAEREVAAMSDEEVLAIWHKAMAPPAAP